MDFRRVSGRTGTGIVHHPNARVVNYSDTPRVILLPKMKFQTGHWLVQLPYSSVFPDRLDRDSVAEVALCTCPASCTCCRSRDDSRSSATGSFSSWRSPWLYDLLQLRSTPIITDFGAELQHSTDKPISTPSLQATAMIYYVYYDRHR